MQAAGIEMPETIQGEPKFNAFIEENENIKDYLIKYFRDLVLPQ